DVNYYITKGGGYNWNADQSGLKIIKARTGQRFKPGRGAEIEGGDTIHIPENKPVDYWQFFRDTAAVFADVATVIIIARNIK
ncbi:MAG TPA: hypothetical protein VMZ04_00050, partial [Anaerolineae bacterium]|nr:hypothetical protein [Anaerolineae bacterium]